ncbi:MAG: transketolase [Phycisphaerae bacterium]|nr:transketolase [Phycisphaerae bacterium]
MTTELARRIRVRALRMVNRAVAPHIGGCLSVADILAVLYGRVLRVDPAQPDWPERDRMVLSKGHAAAALYAVLAERGFFPAEWLETYSLDGTRLAGHVTHYGVPGVDFSSGSLGHGLSVACGMALAGRGVFRAFAVLSDGECDEGSTWEAALFAPHHKLDNLIAIVDYNKIQSFGTVAEVLDLEPFADKWRAFGWSTHEVDGHDTEALQRVLSGLPREPGKPTAIIAHTVKGKGVSFMENKLLYHYRTPNDEAFAQALAELGERS